jgi:hypothetical protein
MKAMPPIVSLGRRVRLVAILLFVSQTVKNAQAF